MSLPAAPGARFTLLLTASIAPKVGVSRTFVRTDPAVRLGDYCEALRFWLRLRLPEIGAIVFAENTGYPLDAVAAVVREAGSAAPPVELLSFDHPPPPEGLHYGYSEFELVNAALDASAELRRRRHFIKVTGRYHFPDLPRLLRRLPDDFRVAVDSRGLRPWPLAASSNPIATVGLALFERRFYERELGGLTRTMVPAPPWTRQQFIESVLFDALWPRRNEPGILLRWPVNCEPVGWGSNGDDYRSLGKRWRAAVRAAARVVCPSLWI
jgi:hypothetical protein